MSYLGTISHQWDQITVGYNTTIIFPGRTLDAKHKALILGAAFLLVSFQNVLLLQFINLKYYCRNTCFLSRVALALNANIANILRT